MKNQALVIFLRKIKVKKIKCRLLQFLFGALRVEDELLCSPYSSHSVFCNRHLHLFQPFLGLNPFVNSADPVQMLQMVNSFVSICSNIW